MADLEWHGRTEPASLRRALRHALRQRSPELRVVAEGVLGEVSSIDLLAVGADGELVAIRIAAEATEGADSLLLTRGLADLTWLRPRAADLIKLAPGLGLELGAEPRAILVARHFGPEVVAASENLPARSLELVRWRGLRQQGQLTMLLEAEKPSLVSARPRRETPPPPRRARNPESAPQRHPEHVVDPYDLRAPDESRSAAPLGGESPPALTDPPSASTFRTGLTDADLRLERASVEI